MSEIDADADSALQPADVEGRRARQVHVPGHVPDEESHTVAVAEWRADVESDVSRQADAALATGIANALSGAFPSAPPLNLAGKTTLRELCALLRRGTVDTYLLVRQSLAYLAQIRASLAIQAVVRALIGRGKSRLYRRFANDS